MASNAGWVASVNKYMLRGANKLLDDPQKNAEIMAYSCAYAIAAHAGATRPDIFAAWAAGLASACADMPGTLCIKNKTGINERGKSTLIFSFCHTPPHVDIHRFSVDDWYGVGAGTVPASDFVRALDHGWEMTIKSVVFDGKPPTMTVDIKMHIVHGIARYRATDATGGSVNVFSLCCDPVVNGLSIFEDNAHGEGIVIPVVESNCGWSMFERAPELYDVYRRALNICTTASVDDNATAGLFDSVVNALVADVLELERDFHAKPLFAMAWDAVADRVLELFKAGEAKYAVEIAREVPPCARQARPELNAVLVADEIGYAQDNAQGAQ